MRNKFLSIAASAVLLFSQGAAVSQEERYDGSSTQLAQFALSYERARINGGVPASEAGDVGYFQGFVTGVFVSGNWPCAKDAIRMEQVWAVVAKYVREHPEQWGLSSQDLVRKAAESVWGCASARRR